MEFILLSLRDSQAKKLARVINNETSQKIIDYLSEKKATETQISEELDIPLSTVHYNIKQLMKAKLVKSDEFHYSEKGKEVNHYTLTGKNIIITPTEGIKSKLGSLVLVLALVFGVSFFIGRSRPQTMLAERAMDAAYSAPEPNIRIWFLIGGVSAAVLFLFFQWLISKIEL